MPKKVTQRQAQSQEAQPKTKKSLFTLIIKTLQTINHIKTKP
jgi:hypothetical protein